MAEYAFDCYDIHNGQQNLMFVGVGETREEAKINANIPNRCEINDVLFWSEKDYCWLPVRE